MDVKGGIERGLLAERTALTKAGSHKSARIILVQVGGNDAGSTPAVAETW